VQHYCLTCNTVTRHRHLHDTAHGIAGTHMAGSERFQCRECERTTFAHSEGAEAFPFVLDGKAQRTIAA
jgi:hypothetical protein